VLGFEPYDTFSSPRFADIDGDGADDGTERTKGSDPSRADTDGDGVNDGKDKTPLRRNFNDQIVVNQVVGASANDPAGVQIAIDPATGLPVIAYTTLNQSGQPRRNLWFVRCTEIDCRNNSETAKLVTYGDNLGWRHARSSFDVEIVGGRPVFAFRSDTRPNGATEGGGGLWVLACATPDCSGPASNHSFKLVAGDENWLADGSLLCEGRHQRWYGYFAEISPVPGDTGQYLVTAQYDYTRTQRSGCLTPSEWRRGGLVRYFCDGPECKDPRGGRFGERDEGGNTARPAETGWGADAGYVRDSNGQLRPAIVYTIGNGNDVFYVRCDTLQCSNPSLANLTSLVGIAPGERDFDVVDAGTGAPGFVFAGTNDVRWVECTNMACTDPIKVSTIASADIAMQGSVDVMYTPVDHPSPSPIWTFVNSDGNLSAVSCPTNTTYDLNTGACGAKSLVRNELDLTAAAPMVLGDRFDALLGADGLPLFAYLHNPGGGAQLHVVHAGDTVATPPAR
jgi:hypothetical protein